MIFFDFIPLHCVLEEIKPNVARHYTEMTEGDEYGEPDMDWDLYVALSKMNRCYVVTARDKGKLVGYSAYTFSTLSRYRTVKSAANEALFLEKEYRSKYSRIFIRKCEQYLMLTGVSETKYILSDDRVGRLLGANGYQTKYKVWSVKYGK